MLTDPPYKNRDEAVAGLKTQQKPGFNYGDIEDSPNTVSQQGNKPYSTKWDKSKAGGLSYAEWIKLPGNKEKEDKFVASTKDKISATYGQQNKQQNNVSNTKPTSTGNGNIAEANASIGNITIGGNSTKPQASTSTNKPTTGTNTNTKPATGTSTQYTGNNSAANRATANASIGNITINTGGSGGSGGGPGGGGPGKISDLLGGIKPNMQQPAFKKTTGITQNTPGGKTPYKFRGLENQFQSWQMNRYNNDTTT